MIFVTLIDKNCLQNFTVFRRKLIQESAYMASSFLGQQFLFTPGGTVHRLGCVFIELSKFSVLPKVFEQHIVTDGVNVRAQTGRIIHAVAAAQLFEHTEENLLAQVEGILAGPEPATNLDQQERFKICDEVALDFRVAQ